MLPQTDAYSRRIPIWLISFGARFATNAHVVPCCRLGNILLAEQTSSTSQTQSKTPRTVLLTLILLTALRSNGIILRADHPPLIAHNIGIVHLPKQRGDEIDSTGKSHAAFNRCTFFKRDQQMDVLEIQELPLPSITYKYAELFSLKNLMATTARSKTSISPGTTTVTKVDRIASDPKKPFSRLHFWGYSSNLYLMCVY